MGHDTINPIYDEMDTLTKCKGWLDSRWADIIYLRDPKFDRYVMRVDGREYIVEFCPFCGVKVD